MQDDAPVLPSDGETIAELRELYRAAEARSARLRLLSISARELAQANASTLDATLAQCAERLAFFVGSRGAQIAAKDHPSGFPIKAPGHAGEIIATVVIDGLKGIEDIPSSEDRDTLRMELDLIGATIDRLSKEQERASLVVQLQERERTLEKLLERIFTAQEDERRRVSHELHDGVAQTATALVRLLESSDAASGKAMSAAGGMAPAEVARGLVSELRRVIAGLRPTLLDDLGLLPAIQALGEGLQVDGYDVTQDLSGDEARLSPLIENAVFRVAQEAVANIRKHAGGACRVRIEAHLASDPLILRISDEGCGPSDETLATGLLSGDNVGIEVMRERMASIGGSVEWQTGNSSGVIVEAKLPADSRLMRGGNV